MNQDILDRMTALLGSILNDLLMGAASRWGARFPDVLWHYTKPEAFLKILEHGTLRASHIRFMNDEREYIHAAQFVLDGIAAARSTMPSQHAQAVLVEMERFFTMGLSLATSNAVFAGAFSAARDDLSQWRAYGGAEGGISIGFAFDALLERVQSPGVPQLLLPVEYDEVRQRRAADQLVQRGVQLYEQLQAEGVAVSARDYAFALNEKSTELAAIPKHKTFRAEDEWRIVRRVEPSDLSKVTFIGHETVITPAWDFDLKLPTTGRMPLAEIIVGPGRMAAHTAEAVRALLVQRGYGSTVPVTSSGVPYRVVK
ncbi:DUF2971 domain-containing protein [Reyranella sp.]|uniref:DUF2971 domain-containing protein n=1 Tax=Reyranella sp. TaxID=1929291 RepID=UPI003D11A11D